VTEGRLLQDVYRQDPWRIFVACILLNQTARVQVDRVVRRVFALWPDAYAMRDARLREVKGVIEETGLGFIKAYRLIRMSDDYITWHEKGTMLPEQIFGVGQYGVDSYEIFFCKHLNHPVPSADKELLAYVARQTANRMAAYDDAALELFPDNVVFETKVYPREMAEHFDGTEAQARAYERLREATE
jgi:endonuclease III